MCKSGGGSPPVPSASSTTFNSTVTPNAPAGALYTDFLNRANALSNTPFNPAMLGSVAPMNAQQLQGGNQLFTLGMDMGTFHPEQVKALESPYTEDVVNATQNWFNNQNAIQGNDLISQAIRSGNAFGGDRAGVAEGILAGQQQLAQAPVIAGLRQAGYTQALDEYNKLKQFGIQGAGAALGWGGLLQQQSQRELDVAQQNAMLSSAYPFQTMNWYGSILGGIAPLLGTTASGANNPPTAGGTGLGAASAAVGLGTAALGAFGGGGTAGPGQKDGGIVGRARGGIVGPYRFGGLVGHYDDGGDVFGSEPLGGPSDIGYRTDDDDRPSRSEEPPPSRSTSSPRLAPTTATSAGGSWGRNVGQLKTSARQLPQPVFPSTGGGGSTTQPKSEAEQWMNLGTSAIKLGAAAAPYLAMLSDPKTKTDVQRVGRTDDGEPLYGFRYKGDPKTYPKVVGPMAVPHHAEGGRVRKQFDPVGDPGPGGLWGWSLSHLPRGKEMFGMRSEATQAEMARRGIAANPPPSILESIISPQSSSVRDAIRRGHIESLQQTGEDYRPERRFAWGGGVPHLRHGGFGGHQASEGEEEALIGTRLRQLGFARGGLVNYYDDGGDVDEPLTMTDLGVLSPGGRALPESISGPVRGSPGGLPEQAADMPNLARVRERFRPVLENDPKLARQFDINTTAEVGTDPNARRAYQALTLDRAAARGESLPYTLSRGPGTPDRYYPGTTTNATRPSGMGVAPSIWMGANPVNFATGNASYDPKTGRYVGFAGGPQTGSVATGSGTEYAGIEGPDLAAARRFGYTGPSSTGIGPRGPQGTQAISAKMVDEGGDRGEKSAAGPETRSSAERTGSTQPSLRSDRTVDALAKPAPTFAQRLATNPFWQFGTALMARPGIKGREGQAIGSALESMTSQQLKERNRVLDEKPQMITRPDGSVHFLNSEGRLTQVFGPDATRTAVEKRAQEKWDVEKATPNTLKVQKRGPFGSTTTEEVPYTISPDGTVKPFAIPGQEQPPAQPPAQQPPQRQQPQEPPAEPPPAEPPASPPPPAQPAPNAPAVPSVKAPTIRQSETQPQPQPQQAATGPANIERRTQQAWENGQVAPIGTVTNPGAGQRNESALQGLTPDEQRIVKGIADYTIDPNKVFTGKKGAEQRPAAINKVMEYDPGYDAKNFPTRSQALKEFGVNGQSRKNLESNSMVLEHAGDLMTAIEKLNNYTYAPGIMNPITGKFSEQTDPKYQAALAEFRTAATGVATEMGKTFRGVGSMSEREVKHWEGIIAGQYDSPVALRAAIKTGVGMVLGRTNAIANAHNIAMGPQYERDGESFLAPKARETIARANAMDPEKPSPPSRFGVTPDKPSGGAGEPVRVQSPAEALKLPPGTPIIMPDGRTGTVPQR